MTLYQHSGDCEQWKTERKMRENHATSIDLDYQEVCFVHVQQLKSSLDQILSLACAIKGHAVIFPPILVLSYICVITRKIHKTGKQNRNKLSRMFIPHAVSNNIFRMTVLMLSRNGFSCIFFCFAMN